MISDLPVVTDAENLGFFSSYLVNNFDQTVGDCLERIVMGIERLGRAAIAQGIRRNDTIAFVGEVVDLMAPVVGRRRKAVHEQDVRFIFHFGMLVMCSVVEA